ncbi:MAG: SlyX family protein [Psittacicella sp.]
MNIKKDSEIIELETKLSFQEKLIEDLQEIISNQEIRISRLEQVIQYLYEDKNSQDYIFKSNEDERPPHY